jgi:hypothetical protein
MPKELEKKVKHNEYGTTVVCLKRKNGVVVQDCDVYIGRACYRGGWKLEASKWANPYSVKECGGHGKVCEVYKKYILGQPDLLADLKELVGKRLGCWCKKKPSDPCHGDVLVELIDKMV